MKNCAFFLLCSLLLNCKSPAQKAIPIPSMEVNKDIVVGAERTGVYVEDIKNKRVAIVANQTSLIKNTHLVDSLIALGVNVVKVFAPEHGFRGDASAGASIKDSRDAKTGLPLISLYGKNKKPTSAMLKDVDIVIFDIQDVGARFYTYISTMHYVMEACADANIPIWVLDRPNPNGFYVDGPVLDLKYQSFVGMHPIPIVHGLTIGELAKMIVGENWLKSANACQLTVIACLNYHHNDLYILPVKPSPNLPNMSAVYLYPSLCWFEATKVSVGRGTDFPFQVIGYPGDKTGSYAFTPKEIPGVAEDPPYEGVPCTGHHLAEFGEFYITSSRALYLEWLAGLYKDDSDKKSFFKTPDFFDKLAGTDKVRKQLEAGCTASDLENSWKDEIAAYKIKRKKYLLYPDFE